MKKFNFQEIVNALDWSYTRSSGAGGQHINRTNSAVQLKVDLFQLHLTEEELNLIFTKLSSKIIQNQFLLFRSEEQRDQKTNKDHCLKKAIQTLESALVIPKARKKTKPTFSSKVKRLDKKNNRSQVKQNRKKIDY